MSYYSRTLCRYEGMRIIFISLVLLIRKSLQIYVSESAELFLLTQLLFSSMNFCNFRGMHPHITHSLVYLHTLVGMYVHMYL